MTQRKIKWRVWIGLAMCFTLATGHVSQGDTVYEVAYSFRDASGGGIAVARIDAQTRKFLEPRTVLRDEACHTPLKVRRSLDPPLLAVTNLDEDGPHLFVVQTDSSLAAAKSLLLPSVPDELRIVQGKGLLTCEEDQLVVVDLQDCHIDRIISVDKTMNPPANAPEGITISDDQQYAVVSFQKDSNKGKKLGNRIAIHQWADMKQIADLQLPRNRPQLHIDGNNKEQGPGPELIHISPETDTLLVTLDLYGAVGLMRWSAALENRLDDWTLINTAVDDDWGNAFPDRGTAITLAGRPYYLVCNAGKSGGAALIDLKTKRRVWERAAPPGLVSPVFFNQLGRAYSVCAGKTKVRTEIDVDKTFHPQSGIYVIDFSSRDAIKNKPIEKIETGSYAFGVYPVSHDPPLLVVATGQTQEHADYLVLFDAAEHEILDQQPAEGPIGRLEGN